MKAEPHPISLLIRDRVLVIDGAMGTMIQKLHLSADDYGGDRYVGCSEILSVRRPDVIQGIHEAYLAAGADIISTNSFGAMPLVLDEYGLGAQAAHLGVAAAQVARQAADAYSTLEKPRFVAGSIGPTTKSLAITGGVTFEEMADGYQMLAEGLIRGGVDVILLETAMDTLNLKAGYVGIQKAFERCQKSIPIAISVTIESSQTMLAGQGISALYASVAHMAPLFIGMNCALGPDLMREHIRTLSEISRFPTLLMPNAGLPDETGAYPLGPDDFAGFMDDFIRHQWVNVVGGCCGTTDAHTRAISTLDAMTTFSPRRPVDSSRLMISGIDVLEIDPADGPYFVGERTNVIGSKAFRDLIVDSQFDRAAEIGRAQVQKGAHIIDVCLSNPDRNELNDMSQFLSYLLKKIKSPIMIDSQVPAVVEAAFRHTQGKCILNSVNLENNGRLCSQLLPLVKTYGAAVVVGCIRDGMPKSADERVAIARALYQLLTQDYQIRDENIIFDPLVFPIATGDQCYQDAAKETIRAIQQLRELYPNTHFVLGISNVSFGLPAAGREVLNSVFLRLCTDAGLDMAIVNTEKLARYDQIPESEKQLAVNLLIDHCPDFDSAMRDFVSYFRDKKGGSPPPPVVSTDPKERLTGLILMGSSVGMDAVITELLTQVHALEIIRTVLMPAMDEVGRKFHTHDLIITEVLQSAEAMKTAIDFLNPYLARGDAGGMGRIVIATVKGDVHDIGKNLVKIIFACNGYDVIDLGINVDNRTLVEQVQALKPDLVGLSGLLVKSSQQMAAVAADFRAAGIEVPILVGGAALTAKFVTEQIQSAYGGPVYYCRDAMSGLSQANALMRQIV